MQVDIYRGFSIRSIHPALSFTFTINACNTGKVFIWDQWRNWSSSTWLVCAHFMQIYSCIGIISYACTQITINTCISSKKFVLFTWIQCFMVNAHTFNNHVIITLVILMNCILNDIATCNFLFQWLCLHLTVTNNSCQVWLCFIKSANTFIAVIHLTINFFSNYQHLVVVFTAALSPSIAIHSLLLTHFTNKYLWNVSVVVSEWQC